MEVCGFRRITGEKKTHRVEVEQLNVWYDKNASGKEKIKTFKGSCCRAASRQAASVRGSDLFAEQMEVLH